MPTKIPLVSDGPLSWNSYAAPLFQDKCTSCHGSMALGGLSLDSFADAMQGGNHGPVIVPSNSAESNLVIIQSKAHMGQLSQEELDAIIKWIDIGAPEE
jgi:mono/diheme cytochrome c family protein